MLTIDKSKLEKILREVFQLSNIKPGQMQVFEALQSAQHVMGVFPTGYGKSLCFQIPAKVWGWKVLVISPLLALISDQKRRLEELGIGILDFHSQLDAVQKRDNEQRLFAGDWQIILLSPERIRLWLQQGHWQRIARLVQLIVLDEAHCFLEWKEFRSAYAELDNWFKQISSQIPLLGLSATIKKLDITQLETRWGLRFSTIYEALGRENIFIQLEALETQKERYLALARHLRNLTKPHIAIIYCTSRHTADELSKFLDAGGWPATSYHAGLPNEVRKGRLTGFYQGRLRIICATSAFGLGIDSPHIQRIIHWGLPHDIESYWQEVGRAGRSGQAAQAILLWSLSDLHWRLRRNAAQKVLPLEKLRPLVRYTMTQACRKKWVAGYLGLPCRECHNCDNCHERSLTGLRTQQNLLCFPGHKPWWLQDKTIARVIPGIFAKRDG